MSCTTIWNIFFLTLELASIFHNQRSWPSWWCQITWVCWILLQLLMHFQVKQWQYLLLFRNLSNKVDTNFPNFSTSSFHLYTSYQVRKVIPSKRHKEEPLFFVLAWFALKNESFHRLAQLSVCWEISIFLWDRWYVRADDLWWLWDYYARLSDFRWSKRDAVCFKCS